MKRLGINPFGALIICTAGYLIGRLHPVRQWTWVYGVRLPAPQDWYLYLLVGVLVVLAVMLIFHRAK